MMMAIDMLGKESGRIRYTSPALLLHLSPVYVIRVPSNIVTSNVRAQTLRGKVGLLLYRLFLSTKASTRPFAQ